MRLKKLLKFLKNDEYIVLTNKNDEIIDSEYCKDFKLLKRYKKHRNLKVVSFYYIEAYLGVDLIVKVKE